MRNATCADTQTSNVWPYCSLIPVQWLHDQIVKLDSLLHQCIVHKEKFLLAFYLHHNYVLSLFSSLDKPLLKLLEHPSYESIVNTLKSQLESICDTYPKFSAQLQPNPPTVAALITSSGYIQYGHPIPLGVMAYFIIKT